MQELKQAREQIADEASSIEADVKSAAEEAAPLVERSTDSKNP